CPDNKNLTKKTVIADRRCAALAFHFESFGEFISRFASLSLKLYRNNMPQAIIDPEEVRRFADELKRFNSDLQNRLTLLQARFASLADSWQDQEHAKFAEEFKQTMKAFKKCTEISHQHTPYLLRKAQRIEEYLNQRCPMPSRANVSSVDALQSFRSHLI